MCLFRALSRKSGESTLSTLDAGRSNSAVDGSLLLCSASSETVAEKGAVESWLSRSAELFNLKGTLFVKFRGSAAPSDYFLRQRRPRVCLKEIRNRALIGRWASSTSLDLVSKLANWHHCKLMSSVCPFSWQALIWNRWLFAAGCRGPKALRMWRWLAALGHCSWIVSILQFGFESEILCALYYIEQHNMIISSPQYRVYTEGFEL